MDENREFLKDLVHLSRLALEGKSDDIEIYVRRLARKLRDSQPEAAEALSKFLRDSPVRSSLTRNANLSAAPVDRDSRLQLIRTEAPKKFDVEPSFVPDIKAKLDLIISERNRMSALSKAGLHPSKSFLFVGKPGVGKTLTARWLASQLNLPLIILDLSAVISSFLGRTGANVRNVFDYAKGMPCVLLLDELDAVAKRRNDTAELGELKRLVTVLLQEIDDWPSKNILVGATNHPELLDPAVWRRFDMILEFPLPAQDQIQKTISSILKGSNKEVEEYIPVIAHVMAGESYSDIVRDVTRMKRASIVHGIPFKDEVMKHVIDHAKKMSHEDRISLAKELVNKGLCSQRLAKEITGVSRDTIRARNIQEG